MSSHNYTKRRGSATCDPPVSRFRVGQRDTVGAALDAGAFLGPGYRRVLRGELNVGDSIRMIARLLASRLELHQPPGLHVRALQLASQLKQNAAYDAHYLALAESVGCELWTADERFYRAASPSIGNVRWIGEFVAPE